MSKNIKGHKWFEIVEHGELFDSFDGLGSTSVPHNESGPDSYATHKNRDRSLIAYVRQYGEVLMNGLAEPRDIGKYLQELADEAESIEAEVHFGYEK